MRKPQSQYAWALIFLCGSAALSADSQSVPVSRANLCVTEGTIEELPGQRLSVSVPKMRAYVNAYTQPVAEVRFASPANLATMVCGPTARLLVVQTALLPPAVALRATALQPVITEPSAMKLILSTPETSIGGFRDEVKVTDWPEVLGLTLELKVTSMGALFTVC